MSLVPHSGSRYCGYSGGIGDLVSSDFNSKSRRRPSSRSSFFQDSFSNNNDIFDSVFSSTRNMFSQMDRMMGSMMRDPFENDPFFGGSAFPALMGPPVNNDAGRRRNQFDMLPFGNMMSAMENVMREGSCHSYSSSSVMTMTTGPDGRPQAPILMQKTDGNSYNWREVGSRGAQVYQASASSRSAPGGVRETRKSMADSSSGVRKMAIGHHIGDRSHVLEKEMNRGGDLEERQEFVNLDEEEAEDFNREFKRKTQQALGAIEHRPKHRNTASPSRQRYLPALPASSSYRRRTRPMLAITSGSRY